MTLRVVTPFLGAQMGGSHVLALALLKSLQDRHGAEALVIAPEGALILEEAGKLGLRSQASGERPAGRARILKDLRRIGRRRALLGSADIVHCHDLQCLQSWAAPARAAGARIVYHHQGLTRRLSPRRVLPHLADQVICVSEVCRANILGFPPSRLHLIHNAFQTPPPDPEWRRRLAADLDLDSTSRLVAFVGNLWKRKRPDFFVECCAVLAAQDPQIRFIVFGREGDMSRHDLESLASQRGIADKLRFAGFRLPPEANVGAVDLIAAPALREPFGRTLVEAALLGVPYVATEDAGHVEIARRWGGGALVPRAATPKEFALTVLRVLHDPSGTILAQSARQGLAAELSSDAIAGKVLEVYRLAQTGRDRVAMTPSSGSLPQQPP